MGKFNYIQMHKYNFQTVQYIHGNTQTSILWKYYTMTLISNNTYYSNACGLNPHYFNSI